MILKIKLEVLTGNPFLKKKYLVKLMQIKKVSYLCDIQRIKNTNTNGIRFANNTLQAIIKEEQAIT